MITGGMHAAVTSAYLGIIWIMKAPRIEGHRWKSKIMTPQVICDGLVSYPAEGGLVTIELWGASLPPHVPGDSVG